MLIITSLKRYGMLCNISIKVNQMPFMDYTIRYGWIYKINQLCVPAFENHLTLIKDVHASFYGGHFWVSENSSTLTTTFILAFYDSSSGAIHLCLCIVKVT
jgi:hypothetical protein